MKKYDVAAYIWPAYTGDEPRTRLFWPEGIGEWQSVKNSVKKYPEHSWPRKPVWGYVNEADPYVMEMQINAAADHILWYSFYCMRQDSELASDALALSYINPGESKKYGQTIIRLVESFSKHTHVYGMASTIEEKSQIKRRITMISLFNKNSYKWSIISVIVLLIFSCIVLTNAKGGTNDANQDVVWQDIKQTYSIDEQVYYRVRTDRELKQFLNGKLNGFTDKDLINQYDKILNADQRFKLPEGATKPILLLKMTRAKWLLLLWIKMISLSSIGSKETEMPGMA